MLLIQDETDNLIYESWYVHSSFGREEKHQTARNLSILMCHIILMDTGTKSVRSGYSAHALKYPFGYERDMNSQFVYLNDLFSLCFLVEQFWVC